MDRRNEEGQNRFGWRCVEGKHALLNSKPLDDNTSDNSDVCSGHRTSVRTKSKSSKGRSGCELYQCSSVVAAEVVATWQWQGINRL